MSSDLLRRLAIITLIVGMAANAGAGGLLAQAGRATLRFFPDDPIQIDDDTVLDASKVKGIELSEWVRFPGEHLCVSRRRFADPRRQREHAG